MRRLTPVLTAAALVLATLVASPQAAIAAPKPTTTGTVVVHLNAPNAVPAEVVLTRVHSRTRLIATKPIGGRTRTTRLKAAPQTYTVSVPSFVYKGVQYGGTASTKRVSIRAGRTTTISMSVHALPGSRAFTATGITTSSIDLSWSAPKRSQVVLRRATGGSAPARRTSGTTVKVTGRAAHDTRLAAGSTYSYSLFTKVSGQWSGPLALHARTATTATSTKAAYVVQPGTVFTKPADLSSARAAGSSALTVVLTTAAPTPQVGQALVLPISSTLPGGYLGVVTGVASDGRTVQLHEGGLADAFQQYRLTSGDPTIGATNRTTAAPRAGAPKAATTHLSRTAGTRATRPFAASTDPGSPESTSRLHCDGRGVDATVDFTHKLDFGHYVNTTVDNGDATFDLRFTAKATGAITADVVANAACVGDIFTGVRQVSVDPVPLLLKWDISASVQVQGGVTVSNLGTTATGGFGTRGTLGLHGFHQSSYPIFTGQPLTPTVQVDHTSTIEAKLGGSVAFGLGAGTDPLGGLVGIKAEVDPIDAKAEIGPAENGSSLPCTKVSAGLHWSGDLDAEFWAGWFHAGATAHLIGGDFPYFDPFYAPSGCNVAPAPAPTPTPTPTPPATDVRTISNASTSADLNCTLNTTQDQHGEYFGDSACGTFLSVGGTLYGPATIPAGSGLASATTPVAWTPVSQTSSGSGTTADPYTTVTTVSAASTGVQLVQTDKWVSGSTQVTTRMEVVNTTGSALAVRLYHAFDCYTAGDDIGTGGIDAANATVGCVHVNADNAAVLSLRLHAVTPGATWSEGAYDSNWAQVGAQGDLNGAAVTTGDYDNGESIAWAVTVPAGGSTIDDAVTSFGGPM